MGKSPPPREAKPWAMAHGLAPLGGDMRAVAPLREARRKAPEGRAGVRPSGFMEMLAGAFVDFSKFLENPLP